MSTSKLLRAGAALGALLAVFSGSRRAHAIACNDPSLPNPIYAVGGSGPVPILQAVATALGKLSTPITFIYQSTGGACAGVNAFVTPSTTGLTGNGTYWTTAGTATTCTYPTPGPAPDLGVADSYATLCPGVSSVPAGVGDFLGPIQAFDFIVPAGSSESSISAEAGYFIFAFGAGSSSPSYPVSPWTVPKDIITRNNQAGTAIITAATLGVPLADLANTTIFTDGKNSAGSLSDVQNSTNPDATLGIVTAEIAEGATAGTIKVLAYQHYGQACGWLPNSTPATFDKINVRTGLYALWSNIHFIASVDSNNVPTDANAKNVIGWFQDTIAPPAGVDVDALTVQAGGILQCAMEVQRSTDAGPLLPYAPAAPCGCFFEANVPGGSTSCQVCTTGSQCPSNAPQCRKGYCEVN
jgi:hypothetical protein